MLGWWLLKVKINLKSRLIHISSHRNILIIYFTIYKYQAYNT